MIPASWTPLKSSWWSGGLDSFRPARTQATVHTRWPGFIQATTHSSHCPDKVARIHTGHHPLKPPSTQGGQDSVSHRLHRVARIQSATIITRWPGPSQPVFIRWPGHTQATHLTVSYHWPYWPGLLHDTLALPGNVSLEYWLWCIRPPPATGQLLWYVR